MVQQQKAECTQKLEGLSMWLAGAASLLASQRPGAESGDVDILQEKQRKLKVGKSYINLSFMFVCIRFSSVILDIALVSLKILVTLFLIFKGMISNMSHTTLFVSVFRKSRKTSTLKARA